MSEFDKSSCADFFMTASLKHAFARARVQCLHRKCACRPSSAPAFCGARPAAPNYLLSRDHDSRLDITHFPRSKVSMASLCARRVALSF